MHVCLQRNTWPGHAATEAICAAPYQVQWDHLPVATYCAYLEVSMCCLLLGWLVISIMVRLVSEADYLCLTCAQKLYKLWQRESAQGIHTHTV